MLAEALVHGGQILRPAHAHHAYVQDHYILFFGAGVSQGPLQCEGIGGVAHGYHDAAGTDGRRLPVDRILVFQLELILHLPRGQRVLA